MENRDITAQKDNTRVTQVRREREDGWKRFAYWMTSGTFAVDTGHYILLFGGTVSSTAMLCATLWITVCATAPEFVQNIQPIGGVLTSLAFVSFALLPEIITYKAIVKCLKLIRSAVRKQDIGTQGERYTVSRIVRLSRWSWSFLYVVPTSVFICMTLATLLPFTLSHGVVSAVNGNTLGIRAVAGWFYVLIGLIEREMEKEDDVNGTVQVVYTQGVSATERLEYTLPCQVPSTSVLLPLSQEATPHVSQSISTHSEQHTSTLETPDSVHVDTVAIVSEEEHAHDESVKTTKKSVKSDSVKRAVNKSEWIRSMYSIHPGASISEIQQLAIAEGFTVSKGLVSDKRI